MILYFHLTNDQFMAIGFTADHATHRQMNWSAMADPARQLLKVNLFCLRRHLDIQVGGFAD